VKTVNKLYSFQERIAEKLFDGYAVTAMYWSYGFVFFFFGLQKPAPAVSPPRFPISSALSDLGIAIPLEYVILFIGAYEMFLGLLFFFRKIRTAFWFFWTHQITTFLVLVLIPFEIFQPPWLEIGAINVPWLLDSFSAFVLKNLVFIAGFMLLYKNEVLDKKDKDEKRTGEDRGLTVF
jgi:hypothetical protein